MDRIITEDFRNLAILMSTPENGDMNNRCFFNLVLRLYANVSNYNFYPYVARHVYLIVQYEITTCGAIKL